MTNKDDIVYNEHISFSEESKEVLLKRERNNGLKFTMEEI